MIIERYFKPSGWPHARIEDIWVTNGRLLAEWTDQNNAISGMIWRYGYQRKLAGMPLWLIPWRKCWTGQCLSAL